MSESVSRKSGKKRKKHSESSQGAAIPQQLEARLNVDQEATQSSLDERRFQPGEEFHVSDATCTMDVGATGAEICLIQLPLSWDLGSEGTLQLPTAARGGLGRCTSNEGQAYHVLEEPIGNSRIFAFAPGQQAPPSAIQRHFKLIRETNLDLQDFAADNKAASETKQKHQAPAKEKKKKKKEKRKDSGNEAGEASEEDLRVKKKKMKKKDKKNPK